MLHWYGQRQRRYVKSETTKKISAKLRKRVHKPNALSIPDILGMWYTG
jgi:hypothetical protein